MEEPEFRSIVEDEWDRVPSPYKERIRNVALLIEDEPSDEVRKLEGLGPEETLLGLYQGVPQTERGSEYGVGMTLPDTITVYRLPTLLEAAEAARNTGVQVPESVRHVVRETIWHEIGHYFGHPEDAIAEREGEGSNIFPLP